jgi:hypothetical protein
MVIVDSDRHCTWMQVVDDECFQGISHSLSLYKKAVLDPSGYTLVCPPVAIQDVSQVYDTQLAANTSQFDRFRGERNPPCF